MGVGIVVGGSAARDVGAGVTTVGLTHAPSRTARIKTEESFAQRIMSPITGLS